MCHHPAGQHGGLPHTEADDPRSRREYAPVHKFFSNLSPVTHLLLSHQSKGVTGLSSDSKGEETDVTSS